MTGDELRLPFPKAPAHGVPQEVAEDLFWVRLPLPFRLNHVNIWLLRTDHGWAAIDCGIDSSEVRSIWKDLLAGILSGNLRKLIATHGHTDHIGLAGDLTNNLDVPFFATSAEWLSATSRYASRGLPDGSEKFFTNHGCDASLTCNLSEAHRHLVLTMGPQPFSYQRLRDGEVLALGKREWKVMVASGHADEHVSLFCENECILIAGDQILERISPIIGIYPSEPKADPLTEYLVSLDRFKKLPADTLVLPSHGLPFYNLQTRIDQLKEHHAMRLNTLRGLLSLPKTGSEAAQALFCSAFREGQGYFAFAETLAHLHRLVTTGVADMAFRPGGHLVFERTAQSHIL